MDLAASGLVAAARLPGARSPERDLHQGQLAACVYLFRWELPRARRQSELLNNLDRIGLAMRDAWF